jgi:hypothetical protein
MTAVLDNMEILGGAAPAPRELQAIAAERLGERTVDLLSADATALAPVYNMTTGGLWRVRGTARTSCEGPGGSIGVVPFSVVVKLIQSPLLWTGIGQVPEHFRHELARRYPWRTEAQVYASGLDAVMPDGGRLPEVYRITELDEQRTAIWMEDVPELDGSDWTDQRFGDAARLLGRLAGSPGVKECVDRVPDATEPGRLRFYVEGVGASVFIPAIRSDTLWRHPAVAAAADARLIAGMRGLADRAFALVDEIAVLPQLPVHGDASPQNLLVERRSAGAGPTGFAVIDWGMYGLGCAGFDLGQLLSGWVNQGTMGGEELHRLEPLCLAAYCEGLADSGACLDESIVRRGHAASMAVFTGLSAIPTQRLEEQDSDELRGLVSGRMAMARFVLDLLASTD